MLSHLDDTLCFVKVSIRQQQQNQNRKKQPANLPKTVSRLRFSELTVVIMLLPLLRVCSFGVIRIRISDPISHGSWYIKGTDESTLVTNLLASLMYHDPSDLGSLIRIRITPKERTLRDTKM